MAFKQLPRGSKAVLAPFAEDIARWGDAIDQMDDDDLFEVDLACDRLTNTNCWWAEFHAAKLLRQMVRWEQERRAYLRTQNDESAVKSRSDAK